MAIPRSLQLPGPEYSEQEERQFRRELEDYLLKISSDLEGAQTRLGTVSSQATKRSLLSMIPVGRSDGGSSLGGGSVTSVDGAGTTDNTTVTGGPITTSGTLTVDLVSTGVSAGAYKSTDLTVDVKGRITAASTPTPSYYCGSKSLGSGTTTVATKGVTWATKPGTWTANTFSLWAENGTTGDIVYTGTATRKFFVSWSLTLDFTAAGAIYASGTSITGKIRKTPSGGSEADVAGSIGESERGYWLFAYGTYYHLHNVSRGAIVEVAENDSLSFYYGFANRNNVTTTYTATLKQNTDTNFAGTVKGVTLNIVPAEAAT